MKSRSATKTKKKKADKVIELEKLAKERGLVLLKAGKRKRRLDVEKPTLDNLRAQLAMTFELIPIAEATYRKHPYDKNAIAVTRLVETAVALMEKIEEQAIEGVVERIEEKVLRPLTTETVAALSQEIRALRDDLKAKLPTKHSAAVDRQMKDLLLRVGKQLDKAYQQSCEELRKILTLK